MNMPAYRSKRNGVPILSKDEIDLLGEQLVTDFCPEAMRRPSEIDIDRFVSNYLGLKQDFQYLSHCGVYLGMMVFNDTNRIPVYNPGTEQAEYISAEAGTVIIDSSLLEENKEHRYRFTMGHEGSHALLHTAHFGYDPNQLNFFGFDWPPVVQCRIDSGKLDCKPTNRWKDADWMEWQANRLSSAILMPRRMVTMLLGDASGDSDIVYISSIAAQVSDIFNVSFAAAKYRLKELGYIKKDLPLSDASVIFADPLLISC